MVVKLSVNLSDEVVKALKEVAEKENVSMTEVIRRAISTQKFLSDAQEKDGKVLVESKDGSVREVVFR